MVSAIFVNRKFRNKNIKNLMLQNRGDGCVFQLLIIDFYLCIYLLFFCTKSENDLHCVRLSRSRKFRSLKIPKIWYCKIGSKLFYLILFNLKIYYYFVLYWYSYSQIPQGSNELVVVCMEGEFNINFFFILRNLRLAKNSDVIYKCKSLSDSPLQNT